MQNLSPNLIILFAAIVACVAWCCIPRTKQSNGPQQLPSRTVFLGKHLQRLSEPKTDDHSCMICRDECLVPVQINACGHVTCESCAREWFAAARENKRCPQCQTIVMNSGIGMGEAVVTFTFVALVFNVVAAFLLAFTGASPYFGTCLLVASLHSHVLYCYVRVMWDAGGDWWRQRSRRLGQDIALAIMVVFPLWAIVYRRGGGKEAEHPG